MTVSRAAAQSRTTLDRLLTLDLPSVTGDVTIYRSHAAETAASLFGAEIGAAAQWYAARLGWHGRLRVAVLDRADFARVTTVPYPSPHAEFATGLIVIADRVEEHPGFDDWDLEPFALNAAFAFHEIGHVLARDLGIWSASSWVNELVANMFMAAYVRAQRPQFAGFQSGMPPRFKSTGRFERLAEFDAVYFAMGQWDYLWFHFHLARLADFLVAERDLRAIADDLRREFPSAAPRRESVAQLFTRLERIRHGVTALAGPLARP